MRDPSRVEASLLCDTITAATEGLEHVHSLPSNFPLLGALDTWGGRIPRVRGKSRGSSRGGTCGAEQFGRAALTGRGSLEAAQ